MDPKIFENNDDDIEILFLGQYGEKKESLQGGLPETRYKHNQTKNA